MKHLVICCDGTWNKPGQTENGKVTETNVLKISKLISHKNSNGISQFVHYHTGVGTSRNFLSHILGGIEGDGLNRNIINAYRFIVSNYNPDDKNYLFGFSRGAYTARSLAGLIVNCGILRKENISRIYEAFELYRERGEDSAPHSKRAKDFQNKYSYPPAIHFIGVWDTVGALGIPLQPFSLLNRKKYSFHDTQLSSCVRYAFHALAIDEHRKIFNATLWQLSENGKLNKGSQTIEQVWFPGSHGNVGGGYIDTALSDATLKWMIGNAERAGLGFKQPITEVNPDIINGELRNSKSFWWSLLQGFLPFYRTIFIQDQTFIDQNIIPESYNRLGYNPPNRPPQYPDIRKLAIGEDTVIEVDSSKPFSFSMLYVNIGEIYHFECDNRQRWKDSWILSSPKGYFNPLAWIFGLRVKGVRCFCLCGAYECNDKSAFAIGNNLIFESNQHATITFFANDSKGFYFNNHGIVKLQITRKK